MGNIAQKVLSVLFPNFKGINFYFLSFGKFFDFLHQGPHIGGDWFGGKG